MRDRETIDSELRRVAAELRSIRGHMAARGPDGEGEWLSADGRTGGFARDRSPELLGQCLAVRDRVWDLAIPYAQYGA